MTSKAPKHRIEAQKYNERSLLARVKEIQLAIKTPEKANIELVKACKSQSKLAKLKLELLDINPMSLNTLKEASIRILKNGFNEIDSLRRQLLDTHEIYLRNINHTKNTNSKSSYQEKISNLEKTEQNLINSHVFITDKYSELLNLYRRHLQKVKDGNVNINNEIRLLEQHIKRFGEPGSPALTVVKDVPIESK